MSPADRRDALRLLTYGCIVATARDGARRLGATLTWVSQASFDPPLVMCAMKRGSQLEQAVRNSGVFALNILAADQQAIAQAFFKAPVADTGPLGGQPITDGAATGAPVLDVVPAWLECRTRDWVDRGDHAVVVAEIVGAGARRADAEPLALRATGWKYGG